LLVVGGGRKIYRYLQQLNAEDANSKEDVE
jgi:hypothetical protein